jgi:hypothetical protein
LEASWNAPVICWICSLPRMASRQSSSKKSLILVASCAFCMWSNHFMVDPLNCLMT